MAIASLKKIAKKNPTGFTLLEMLLVVALIAILASIVILAINPGKQLAEARNAQRRSDVNTIMNALYQYAIDHNGTLPSTVPIGTAAVICKQGVINCGVLVDLQELTDNETYITAIPQDPNGVCSSSGACYTVVQSANGRITVAAPYAELDEVIEVTR